MGKLLSPVFAELTALRNSWVRVLSEGEHGCAAVEGGPCGTQLSPSPRVLGELGETWVWMCTPPPPRFPHSGEVEQKEERVQGKHGR